MSQTDTEAPRSDAEGDTDDAERGDAEHDKTSEVHHEGEGSTFSFRGAEGERQPTEEQRRTISKLVGGLQGEAGKVLRSLIDRNPVTTESAEHLMDHLFKLAGRREFLERLLQSQFMKNVRDMQSEITEAVGIASQADVQALREQLDEVLVRLEKLQSTLDDIVVEVEET